MTREDRIYLAKQIRIAAVFYGLEIAADRLSLILDYWESTQVAPPTIAAAYKRFTEESKIHKFPSPAEIMSIIKPKVDAHDIGVLTAAKVLKAIVDFGWNNPTDAKKYIGDHGWAAIRVFGGWEHICKELGVSIDITTFQAQCREIIKSELKVSEITGSNHLSLNSSDGNQKIESKQMSEVLALIKPKEF